LGDTVEPVGRAAADGSVDGLGTGDVDAGYADKGSCCQQTAVEVGHMVRSGAGTRGQREKRRKVGDTHTLPLL
jgi:hypothetical protein